VIFFGSRRTKRRVVHISAEEMRGQSSKKKEYYKRGVFKSRLLGPTWNGEKKKKSRTDSFATGHAMSSGWGSLVEKFNGANKNAALYTQYTNEKNGGCNI